MDSENSENSPFLWIAKTEKLSFFMDSKNSKNPFYKVGKLIRHSAAFACVKAPRNSLCRILTLCSIRRYNTRCCST
jgi:hypothetical protein